MSNEELKNYLIEKFPSITFEESQYLNLTIAPESLFNCLQFLQKDVQLKFDYLFCLSGVDINNQLGVVYHLQSWEFKHIIVVKSYHNDRENSVFPSVCTLWKTAEFHEREAFDLLGIKFENHPDLRRLFLDHTWGFPLRKDYNDDKNIVAL